MEFVKYGIVTVIPAYRVEKVNKSPINGSLSYIKHIIVVEDAIPDPIADLKPTRRKIISKPLILE